MQIDFIGPGTPVENAVIEAFNGRLRDECQNVHQFPSIEPPIWPLSLALTVSFRGQEQPAAIVPRSVYLTGKPIRHIRREATYV